ncbi:hypothetical protein [Megalodesulfovibrio gigas]|uniref:Uncharacterized protein n=1 Tax=Megalodesulfovibrio gigas (strain ATCC 19364 / DSM 1382 / NCIMB 9332 / VKM B-1759) TaxID=1121448 RepID=T2G7K4_MEGG1|nr:hypothetical protein [Megalodesulfovibrio gigas]AGW12106.1 hypothetical protein DGI_0169 [Megalodesulfovibrio gigas DSM 1382 = ATCC 19364]
MVHRLSALALCAVLLCGSPPPASATLAQPLSELEKQAFGENYLLPSPAEVFLALEKAGPVDWTAMASFNPRYDYADNALRALNLGIRAADGFLAIQARNHDKLGKMISAIMTLAEELLVAETILNKGKSFEDLARNGQWEELHGQLDALRDDVLHEMERMGDKDTALLVSTGGWLEGLRATAKTLEEHYSERASTLLYQPKLLRYFRARLNALPPQTRNAPAVAAILGQLDAMEACLNVGYRMPIPQENIRRLAAISELLVSSIESGAGGGNSTLGGSS